MPQETKKAPPSVEEVLARHEHAPTLQGLVAGREDERALLDALEQAFDYRGDVTVTLASGEAVTGYIFDRRTGASLTDSRLRLLTADSDAKRSIAYSDIARIEFTGKDAAHGKSFEGWLRRYVEKKLRGEAASIESETLE